MHPTRALLPPIPNLLPPPNNGIQIKVFHQVLETARAGAIHHKNFLFAVIKGGFGIAGVNIGEFRDITGIADQQPVQEFFYAVEREWLPCNAQFVVLEVNVIGHVFVFLDVLHNGTIVEVFVQVAGIRHQEQEDQRIEQLSLWN